MFKNVQRSVSVFHFSLVKGYTGVQLLETLKDELCFQIYLYLERMKWEDNWGGRHYFVRVFDSTETAHDKMSYIDDVYDV